MRTRIAIVVLAAVTACAPATGETTPLFEARAELDPDQFECLLDEIGRSSLVRRHYHDLARLRHPPPDGLNAVQFVFEAHFRNGVALMALNPERVDTLRIFSRYVDQGRMPSESEIREAYVKLGEMIATCDGRIVSEPQAIR
jgi:hypothetical protein